jgi:hypothetical protein
MSATPVKEASADDDPPQMLADLKMRSPVCSRSHEHRQRLSRDFVEPAFPLTGLLP